MPQDVPGLTLLCALILGAAILYSSVGHGGASGYLAAMALLGVAPAVTKPSALVMNIVVALVGTWRFLGGRLIPWKLLLPLIAGSVPAAYLGGLLVLPTAAHRLALGVILLFAAGRLWWPGPRDGELVRPPHRLALVTVGGGLGLLAGFTGVGGGIFLSPLLILARWEGTRRTAGASAAFILVNSVSGLLGHLTAGRPVPAEVALLAPIALVGGLYGSWLGVKRLDATAMRRVLGVVLLVAGLKLLLVF